MNKSRDIIRVILLALTPALFYTFWVDLPIQFMVIIAGLMILLFGQNKVDFSLAIFSFLMWVIILISLEPLINGIVSSLYGVVVSGSITPMIIVFLMSFISGRFLKSNYIFAKKEVLVGLIGIGLILYKYHAYVSVDVLIRFISLLYISLSSVSIASLFPDIRILRTKKVVFLRPLFILVVIMPLVFTHFIDKSSIRSIGIMSGHGLWAEMKNEYSIKNISMKGGYSYSLMKELIVDRYKAKEIHGEAINYSDVADKDALLFITPTIPFSNNEKAILRKYVYRGGRLIIIADHTDLYGHATVLNGLLNEYGLAVEKNALFHYSDYHKKIITVGSDYGRVRPMTPCSFSLTKPFLLTTFANDWVNESADYTRPNFFGEFNYTMDDGYGRWVTGGVLPYGKGDIVFFGDSTIFSNFALFLPNNLALLDKIIDGYHYSGITVYFRLFTLLGVFMLVVYAKNIDFILFFIVAGFSFITLFDYHEIHWRTRPLILPKSSICIYGQEKYLLESPPGRNLNPLSLSSLYSHIARGKFRPVYSGEYPPKNPGQRSIYITDYSGFRAYMKSGGRKVSKCIIIGDIPACQFGQTNAYYSSKSDSSLTSALGLLKISNRRYYISPTGSLTNKINSTSVLFASGHYSNVNLGSWWINQDLSPFKIEMLRSFDEWIASGKDILPFKYPPISHELKNPEHSWLLKTSTGRSLVFKCRVDTTSLPMKHYFGSGIWGNVIKYQNKIYIQGGEELVDDSMDAAIPKWAAVLLQ